MTIAQTEVAGRDRLGTDNGRPDTSARLVLQRRAPRTIRRHFLRSALRLLALIIGDAIAFASLRTAMWVFRDEALAGGWIAELLRALAPRGYLRGWEYGVALLVGLVVLGSYGPGDRRRDPVRIFLGVALGTALALWSSLWFRPPGAVLAHYLAAVAVVSGAIMGLRLALDGVISRLHSRIRPPERVLMIGEPNDPESAQVRAKLLRGEQMELVGCVMPLGYGGNGNGRDGGGRSGGRDEFWKVLQEKEADTVVLCRDVDAQLFHQIVDACAAAGCRLLAMSRYDAMGRMRPSLVWYHKLPFVELRLPALEMRQILIKRALDFGLAGLGLVVLAPLFAVIAVAIKLDSPGPVFFRQERVGRGGRRFRVWKFRTMRDGASDAAHRELVSSMLVGNGNDKAAAIGPGGVRVYKLVKDERVTHVGRWLRRTSLDELAQLINVLSGDMSLVGPRPPLPYEVEVYDTWQFERLGVLPGITGLWQVSGRNLLTYRQMCQLDIEYVQQWSFWLDLKILWRTIPVVVFNSGRAA